MRIIKVANFIDRQITVELKNGEQITISFEDFIKRAKDEQERIQSSGESC